MAAGFFLIEDTLGGLFQEEALMDELEARAHDHVREIEAWMKEHAPWADRTGAAREGLGVEVERDTGEVSITVFHTVDYGIWLETIESGRFAILEPTLQYWAPIVFDDVGAVQIGVDLS